MSRARQVANFDPALFAADEVSGDKVHGGTISGSPVLVTPNIGTPNAGVVTNLSGVLPIGVTGGSGLTALGTVATGNLSNTNIVYPAGHIIQITQNESDVEAFSNDGSTITGVSHSITLSDNSHKVLALSIARGEAAQTGTAAVDSRCHAGTWLISSGSGVTAQTANFSPAEANGSPYEIKGTRILGFAAARMYLFSPALAGAVTITLQGRPYATDGTYTLRFNPQNSSDGQSQMMLMEVVA